MTDQTLTIEVPDSAWLTSNRKEHPQVVGRIMGYNRSGLEECANIPRGLTTTLDLGKERL